MSEIKAQHVATDEDIARWKESDTPFPAVALDEAIARIEQQEETIRRLTGSLRIIKNCSKDRDAAVEAEMGLAGDSVNGMDQRRE